MQHHYHITQLGDCQFIEYIYLIIYNLKFIRADPKNKM